MEGWGGEAGQAPPDPSIGLAPWQGELGSIRDSPSWEEGIAQGPGGRGVPRGMTGGGLPLHSTSQEWDALGRFTVQGAADAQTAATGLGASGRWGARASRTLLPFASYHADASSASSPPAPAEAWLEVEAGPALPPWEQPGTCGGS